MAENIASLLVELGLDTKQFDTSMQKINTSTKQMEKSFSLAKDAIKNSEDKLSAYSNAISKGQGVIDQYKSKLEALGNNYNKTGENIKKLTVDKKKLENQLNNEKNKLNEIGKTLGKSSQAYKEQETKVKGLEKELSNTDKTLEKNVRSMKSMENQMQETSNKIDSTQNEVKGFESELQKLNNVNLNSLSNKFKKVSDDMQKLGDRLQSVGGKISGFGKSMTIGVTAPIMGIIGASAKARMSLDQMTRKSKIVFGEMQKDVADWAAANPELLQQLIDIGLKIAILAPIIGIVGKVVGGLGTIIRGVGKVGSKVFETLGKKATTSGDDIAKVGGKFQGLSGLMSNPYVLVGALVVLMAKIGESEGAILKLQEKFGGIGIVVGGVCEFISGLWDVTIGQMVNLVGFLSDCLEAVFDGPGGKTIHDAQQKFNAKQEQTAIEGMEKLTLSTTRGMQTLRAMTDGQLQELNATFDLALGNIASVGSGHFGEFAYSVAGSLDGMSSHSINTLQNLNDQTRLMFFGINESMTVDQRAGQIRENLERMKTSGTLDVVELEKEIRESMGLVNSQMDVKPATDKVQSDLANMAKEGSSQAQQMTSNVASEANKLPDVVKPVEQVPKIVEDAMNNANNVNKNGYTQMQQNTIDQLGNMLNDIKQKFQDMIKAMVDIVNSGVANVDSAFMKVFNAVKNIMSNLKIEVSNQMAAIRDEMSNPIVINVRRTISTQSISLPAVEPQTFDVSAYDINSQARYSNSGIVTKGFRESTQKDNSNQDILKALVVQNKLLYQLLDKETNVNVDNIITLDGRIVAKQIAQPIQEELNTINKRKTRLGGNF